MNILRWITSPFRNLAPRPMPMPPPKPITAIMRGGRFHNTVVAGLVTSRVSFPVVSPGGIGQITYEHTDEVLKNGKVVYRPMYRDRAYLWRQFEGATP